MTRLTQALADFTSTDWASFLEPALQRKLASTVRTALLDTAACVLAGRSEPCTALILQHARARYRVGPSSLLFGDDQLEAGAAALVNGVSGHALDYDDVALSGHPSAVLISALWAEYERTGTGGFALVQAYAKGFALWAELQRRQKVPLHDRGWHPTAVIGAVAAAAAVASLRGLSSSQVMNAVGIAASCAGGVIANFGSMTKALHAGRAAECGLVAVNLAQAGFDASANALDGANGLLNALAGPAMFDGEGSVPSDYPLALLRARPSIKKYPVCFAAHRTIDGVLDLARVHRVIDTDVTAIEAGLSETTARVLLQRAPQTVMEARFSLEFMLSAALVYGRLGMAEVSDDALSDPRVRQLMPRVRTKFVDGRCPLDPAFAYEDWVSITLNDGRVLDSGPIRFARGHSELPLSAEALREKLHSCLPAHEQKLAVAIEARIDAALFPCLENLG